MGKCFDVLKKRLNVLSKEVERLNRENQKMKIEKKICENQAQIATNLKNQTDNVMIQQLGELNAANQKLSEMVVSLRRRLKKYEDVD